VLHAKSKALSPALDAQGLGPGVGSVRQTGRGKKPKLLVNDERGRGRGRGKGKGEGEGGVLLCAIRSIFLFLGEGYVMRVVGKSVGEGWEGWEGL